MGSELARIVAEYKRQFYSDASKADRSLLETGRAILEERLTRTRFEPLDAETVQAGVTLLHHCGDHSAIVDLLRRYLMQPLRYSDYEKPIRTVDDEAWARWHLADNLALLGRYDEVVDVQRRFLRWARQCLPKDRLLWVMSDGTQALCWAKTGQADEWLTIFREIITTVDPEPENRLDRFVYIRTASMLLTCLNRPQEALQVAHMIEELAEEDPAWDLNPRMTVECYIVQLNVFQQLGQKEEIQRRAESVIKLLYSYDEQAVPRTMDQLVLLRSLYHNAAAPLYRAGLYHLAIPLFQRAVVYGITSPNTYAWLAASLWATTKDRGKVLPLLREAAHRTANGQAWTKFRALPEFADVIDDEEFAASGTLPQQ